MVRHSRRVQVRPTEDTRVAISKSKRRPKQRTRVPGKSGQAKHHKYIRERPELPFSDAVLSGKTLYLSGRLGLDPKNRKIPEDIETEARNVLEDIRSVLSRAKMTMSDLVYLQIFCTDISLWERFNAVYRTFFDGNMPARAFLGSGALLFGAHFEIQGIAVKR
jgi:2-iminobutanoate/2-iminopropanoate deaminase